MGFIKLMQMLVVTVLATLVKYIIDEFLLIRISLLDTKIIIISPSVLTRPPWQQCRASFRT